jgi:plasmid maintenance system antidote protein VapI
MEKTIDFLDRLKAANDGCSDYRVAQILGLKTQAISSWRKGRSTIGDETAIKVAELLGEHPAYVMACAHAERGETTKAHKVWAQVAAQYAAMFVFVFIGFLGTTPPF